MGVMVLPESVDKWVYVSDKSLKISECMYWCNVTKCDVDLKPNQKDVTIRIPIQNIVGVGSLNKLIDMVSEGREIPYVL